MLGCGKRIADIQLRIKDPTPDQMESVREEIEEAVKLCAATGGGGGGDESGDGGGGGSGGGGGGECAPTRLWVNDHWQLALECGGVYGVHLGHEDLMALLCKEDDSFDQLADSVSGVVVKIIFQFFVKFYSNFYQSLGLSWLGPSPVQTPTIEIPTQHHTDPTPTQHRPNTDPHADSNALLRASASA